MKLLVLSLLYTLSCLALSSGFLLQNVQSGKCVKDINPNREMFVFTMDECTENVATEFEQLVGRETGMQRLSSPWNQRNGQKQPRQKCAFANIQDRKGQDNVWTASCGGRQHCPYLQWVLKDIGDSKFIIIHNMTKWCMKPDDRKIVQIFETCDEADPAFHWTKI